MHTKRLTTPKYWAKNRKAKTWAVTPKSSYKKFKNIPISMILRDKLEVASNMREAQKILHKGLVKVNNRKIKNKNYGAGLMDTIQIGEDTYRIVPSSKGLQIIEIPKKESQLKLAKVTNKTMNNGKMTLNLHDGNNIITKKKKIKVGDTILITLPELKIKKHLPLKKGAEVIITAGKQSGVKAEYQEKKQIRLNPDAAILKKENQTFQTTHDYLMVIGEVKVSP